jgi:hypothetical protein
MGDNVGFDTSAGAENKIILGESGEIVVGDELGLNIGAKEEVLLGAEINAVLAGQLELFLSAVIQVGVQKTNTKFAHTGLTKALDAIEGMRKQVFVTEEGVITEKSRVTALKERIAAMRKEITAQSSDLATQKTAIQNAAIQAVAQATRAQTEKVWHISDRIRMSSWVIRQHMTDTQESTNRIAVIKMLNLLTGLKTIN